MASTETFHDTKLKGIQFEITNPRRRILLAEGGSNRIKSLGHIQTIYEFTRAMWQALKIYKPSLVFEPAFPPYVLDKADQEIQRAGRPAPEIPEEIITWNIIRRTGGSLDSTPFARMKEILPRIREELVFDKSLLEIDSAEQETYVAPSSIGPRHETARVYGMQVAGQFFDNLIQFDIWSKNNRTAEELAEFLENFMTTFRPMFLELGVTKMHFHSRVRDEVILNWRNGLVNRSLIYYVRLEKVSATPVHTIKTIKVNLEFHKFFQSIRENKVSKFFSDYQDRITDKWIQKFAPTESV